MLPALWTIVVQQSNLAERTTEKINHFLDYIATHPNAIIVYGVSDMVLAAHSNTFYLSESKL
jgi:hypothetical protein